MEVRELSRKVEWRDRKSDIAQVYSTGLEYAFLSHDFKQQLPWVYCKDFLHDAIFSILHKTHLSIYGYIYDPEKDPQPNLRRMRLMVANSSDKNFGDKIPAALDFLNQVEKAMKVPSMSRVFKCPEPPKRYAKCGVYLFSGSSKWLLAPPMVSMYTLMVRSGFAHTAGENYQDTIKKIVEGKIPGYQSSDAHQLKQGLPGIERLISEGYGSVFGKDMKPNYPPGVDVGTMHNFFGICAFTGEQPKKHCPQWFKSEKKSKATAPVA